MDSRDASIHSRQTPPPPQGFMMPPFAFGQPFSNNNLVMMGTVNPGSNLVPLSSNPNFSFNPITAPQPFDVGVAAHHQQDRQEPQQNRQQNGSPGSGASAVAEQVKKKRGRPRKYSPDGIGLGLSSNSQVMSKVARGSGDGQIDAGEVNMEGHHEKKQRGRPPGSGKKQMDALGGPGGAGFTPHVIKISPGENIVSKMAEFSQEGSRMICILSANGGVHNVTLQRVAGGTIYNEGQLEIISLSGSLCCLNSNGTKNNTVKLAATLAGPDGKVIGGGVTQELIAATAVQIVAGSFIVDRKKSNAAIQTPVPHMLSFGGSAAHDNSTQLDDAASDSSDDDGGGSNHGPPPSQSPGLYNYNLGQWA